MGSKERTGQQFRELWVNGENEKGREGERENKIKGEWRAGIQGVMVE